MQTAIARTAAVETHADVEQLIHRLCWNFVGKYGGEFDEAVSVANEAFLRAYLSYRPGSSQFTTWLWHQVKWALVGSRKQTKLERITVNAGEEIDLDALPARSRFDPNRLAFELSDDAADIIRMVVDMPRDLCVLCELETPGNAKVGLIRHLQRNLGWSAARVLESFREIWEALQ